MKGRVYEIVCNKTGKAYIGSTRLSLNMRLSIHCYHYKRYIEGNYAWMSSFYVLEGDDYEIHLLEEINFEKNSELIEREKYYIRSKDCVNTYLKRDINEVIKCPCGGRYQYRFRKQHFNTQIHKRYENKALDVDDAVEALQSLRITNGPTDRPREEEREDCAPTALVACN